MIYFTSNGTNIAQDLQNKAFAGILREFIGSMKNDSYVTDKTTGIEYMSDKAIIEMREKTSNKYKWHKAIGLVVTPLNKVYTIEVATDKIFIIDFRNELRITFINDDNNTTKLNKQAIKDIDLYYSETPVVHGLYKNEVKVDDISNLIEAYNRKISVENGEPRYSIVAYHILTGKVTEEAQ